MYHKILVAIDMSEMGQEVFKNALSLAVPNKHNNVKLMLLHVLSGEEENSPLPIPVDLKQIYPAAGNDLTLETWREEWEEFKQTGLNMLGSHSEEATQLGVQTDYQQIPGTPGKMICQVASEWKADLIVIGHRGLSGLKELVLGSVSNYVLHHAPCSVLIVQPPN